MEIVGIVPAAGHATRLQPLNSSKEVLPVGRGPVMDYLVERMRVGGASRVRVVTRPDKSDVIAHCEEIGAEVVLATPATVSASFRAGMNDLADDDIALIGFPDTLWEPVDGYLSLVSALNDDVDIALGLFRIPAPDLPRSDVVVLADDGRIARVLVKPTTPPSDWIWGCAAARVRAVSALARVAWPGEYFDILCSEGHVLRGVPLSDIWLDVGTKEALRRATTANPSAGPT